MAGVQAGHSTEFVARLFQHPLSIHDEIEARLGRFEAGRFHNGVSKEAMTSIITKLDGFDGWHQKTDWTESTDYFLQDIRLSVEYDDGSYSIKRSACRKHTYESYDLLTDTTYDIRVCRKREIPVDVEQEMPTVFRPTHVRIKQRKTYTYRPRDSEGGVWRYDLSIVWHGETKTAAEQWQRSDRTPVYEVEIEYVGGETYRRARGAPGLSNSLLMKCTDLLPGITRIAPPTDKGHSAPNAGP